MNRQTNITLFPNRITWKTGLPAVLSTLLLLGCKVSTISESPTTEPKPIKVSCSYADTGKGIDELKVLGIENFLTFGEVKYFLDPNIEQKYINALVSWENDQGELSTTILKKITGYSMNCLIDQATINATLDKVIVDIMKARIEESNQKNPQDNKGIKQTRSIYILDSGKIYFSTDFVIPVDTNSKPELANFDTFRGQNEARLNAIHNANLEAVITEINELGIGGLEYKSMPGPFNFKTIKSGNKIIGHELKRTHELLIK